jgi:hypothetical protein
VDVDEAIPWRCKRLIVRSGERGALPVIDDVKEAAKRREVDLLIAQTARAIEALKKYLKRTNAILHLTC